MAIQQTLKNTVLFKNTTSGSALTASDVITTSGLVFVSPKVGMGDYKDIGTGQAGTTKTYVDSAHCTASFDIPTTLRKATAAGTAPVISQLLKSAGMTETIVASTSATYAPGLATPNSRCEVFTDGYTRAITGGVSNMKISGKIGELASVTFSYQGFTSVAATSGANPTVTLDSNSTILVTGITAITVGGTSLNCDSFEFDTGNNIAETYTTGLNQFDITDFDPSIRLEAVKTKGTDEQAWTDFGAGTLRAVVVTLGTGAGNQVVITVPYAKLKEVNESDDNGKVKISRVFRCEASSGNDNYSIAWK